MLLLLLLLLKPLFINPLSLSVAVEASAWLLPWSSTSAAAISSSRLLNKHFCVSVVKPFLLHPPLNKLYGG